jgi:hypothetical protein
MNNTNTKPKFKIGDRVLTNENKLATIIRIVQIFPNKPNKKILNNLGTNNENEYKKFIIDVGRAEYEIEYDEPYYQPIFSHNKFKNFLLNHGIEEEIKLIPFIIKYKNNKTIYRDNKTIYRDFENHRKSFYNNKIITKGIKYENDLEKLKYIRNKN